MGAIAVDRWNQPQHISDVEVTFPGSVQHLMPDYADIPREFKDDRNPYVRVVSEWFFRGLKRSRLVVKQDIGADAAFRHLATVLRSFAPKHEHKKAGVAYLMSRWFDLAKD